jgi:hypothetical protein
LYDLVELSRRILRFDSSEMPRSDKKVSNKAVLCQLLKIGFYEREKRDQDVPV